MSVSVNPIILSELDQLTNTINLLGYHARDYEMYTVGEFVHKLKTEVKYLKQVIETYAGENYKNDSNC